MFCGLFKCKKNLMLLSILAVEGDKISIIKSGAPFIPFLSILLLSHTTKISGLTTSSSEKITSND